jgi:hypothetical protein
MQHYPPALEGVMERSAVCRSSAACQAASGLPAVAGAVPQAGTACLAIGLLPAHLALGQGEAALVFAAAAVAARLQAFP